MTQNTLPTQNQTVNTAGSHNNVSTQGVIIDKNKKLADYIKFDAQLGRDQMMSMGKESSLSNADIMKIQGGVSLTQFAPFKVRGARNDSVGEEGEENNESKDEKTQTFEEKMAERQKLEASVEKKVTLQKLGGNYQKTHCMSRAQYMKMNPDFDRFANVKNMMSNKNTKL